MVVDPEHYFTHGLDPIALSNSMSYLWYESNHNLPTIPMRDDYLQNALLVIDDPNILVNVISLRVKQLRRGSRPLVESLEKLSPEDTALREVAERRITYELALPEKVERRSPRINTHGSAATPAKYKTDKQVQSEVLS